MNEDRQILNAIKTHLKKSVYVEISNREDVTATSTSVIIKYYDKQYKITVQTIIEKKPMEICHKHNRELNDNGSCADCR